MRPVTRALALILCAAAVGVTVGAAITAAVLGVGPAIAGVSVVAGFCAWLLPQLIDLEDRS